MGLVSELRRRNVIKVAIAYAVVAWLLIEVTATTFPILMLPDWSVTLVTALLLIAFPVALIFAWAFEITPEGIKREKDVDRSQSITHITGRNIDYIIIAALVLALGFFVFDKFVLDPSRDAELVQATTKAVSERAVESGGVATAEKSIAVLPFANRSANPEDAFFVDGIHDDLLTHISRMGAIKTISRTSVMRYRDSTKSIPEIAGELGVGTVLEGGVQRAGDSIRVNVQLIDARTDDHLWSEIYDRKMSATNIFTIQTEIAEAISEALKTTLSPSERKRIRLVPTDNLDAYEAYLIGRQRLAMRTTESLSESVEYFRQATELDPRFALAWAGLADAYQLHHYYAGSLNHEETYTKVEAALQTALDLDDDLAEAYASLGLLRGAQNNLEEAEQSFERALELNPNYPPANLWYSMLLVDLARQDEAMVRLAAAVELDPMSPIIRVNYARSLRIAGRIEEALEELETVLEINPDFVAAHDHIATIQWQVFNHLDKAAQRYVKVITLDPERSSSYVWLGQLYLDLGAPDRASQLFDRASELAADDTATFWGRLLLQLYRGTPQPIYGDVEALRADFGTSWLTQFFVAALRNQAMARGRYSEALAIYSRWYPQLLAERAPDIGLGDYRAAIDLALVLQEMGDPERAAMLLEGAFAYVDTQRRLGWWAGFWIADVQILALQGRRSEALDALGLAADEGWRSLWWYYLQHDPNLDAIRDEPKFQAVVAEIEADVAAQMRRIREMERNGEIVPVPGVVFEPK